MAILSHNNWGLLSLQYSEQLWQEGKSSSVPKQEQDSKAEPFALSQSLIFGYIRSHDRLTSTCPDPHILRPARADLHRRSLAGGVLIGTQQTFLHLRKVDSIQTKAEAQCSTPGHCPATRVMAQAAGRTGFTSIIFTFANTIAWALRLCL